MEIETSLKIIVFFICLCNYLGNSVEITDCGSSYLKVSNVLLNDCDADSGDCVLYSGESNTIQFSLNAVSSPSTWEKLTNDVSFYVSGTRFNLTVEPYDPCKVIFCPLAQNANTTYKAVIPLDAQYPPVSGDLKWIIKNKLGEWLLCFKSPVTISE